MFYDTNKFWFSIVWSKHVFSEWKEELPFLKKNFWVFFSDSSFDNELTVRT